MSETAAGQRAPEHQAEPEQEHAPAWDAESLSATFQEKFIRLGSMERLLRLLALVAMAGVVLAALLILLRDVPLVRVAVEWEFAATMQVSTPLLVCCILLQALAWSLLLAGAMHAHWPVRLISLALWSAAMVVYGATPFSGGASHSRPLAAAVLVVILGAWALSTAIWAVDRRRARQGQETHRHQVRLLTWVICLVLTLLIYALGWLPDPVLSGLAHASAQQQLFVQSGILIPALFLTGSDFTEWTEVAAGRVGTFLARRRWLLPAVAGVVALALVVNGIRVDAGIRPAVFNLAETLLVVLVALGLGRLLLPQGPTEIPASTLVPTALAMWILAGYSIVVGWTLSFPVGDAGVVFGAAGLHRTATALETVGAALGSYWFVALGRTGTAILELLPVPAAVVLILAGLRAPRFAAAGFLMGVLALGTVVLGDLHNLTAALGWGSGLISWTDATTAPALFCLVLLVWMAVRNDWSASSLALLRLTFVLSLGMQFLSWLVAFFTLAAAHGEALALIQALLLLAAIGWDVATSGAAITNRGGPRAPRHARVLIYFSYALLSASAIAFKALLPEATQSIVTTVAGNSLDAWVLSGLNALGQPLLVIYFVFGVLRWRRQRVTVASA